jgi:hypothetical protein
MYGIITGPLIVHVIDSSGLNSEVFSAGTPLGPCFLIVTV